ncbi:hypothetical protein MHU86_14963 [Fragilaria crotonensis]|nr:hypothetical protein MHU86_14963 [Fragilaria crotonensis]
MAQCSPAYQVVFEDGDRIELGFPSESQQHQDEEYRSRLKMNGYEPNGATKWDDYMRTMAAYLDCGLPNFIEERLNLTSFPAFAVEALRDGARAWPLKPHSDVLDAMFESTKMKAMASFQNLSGVIAFHWSVDKELSDLNTHNVFMTAESTERAKNSWRVLRNEQSNLAELEPCNFYVHRASKTDPTAAPSGCDAILVLVPCSTLTRNHEWAKRPRAEALELYKQQFDEDFISQTRKAVLRRLSAIPSLKGLEYHLLDEVVDTPATYADQYNVAAGTPFALSHGLSQLSVTRPGSSSKTIKRTLRWSQ